MSYSLQSHGRYCPWSSPGKNTGMGCYFLVQGIVPTQGSIWVSHIAGRLFTIWVTREKVRSEVKSFSRVWLFVTPWTVAYQAPLSMQFSRQEYWVGCHLLLQEIFLTQGWNPGLPHCRQMLYHLSHQGKGKHLINRFNIKAMEPDFKPICYLCIQTSIILLGRTKCLRPRFRIQGLTLAPPLTGLGDIQHVTSPLWMHFSHP